MQVRAVLFPRRDIAAVGIAPLTSMYFFGPDRRAGGRRLPQRRVRQRGAAHGQRLGRAAVAAAAQPARGVETSAFADKNPRAFGLIQRARSFAHYEDVKSLYELRPSAWVEPGEGLGQGFGDAGRAAERRPSRSTISWCSGARRRRSSPARRTSTTTALTWALAQPEELPLAEVVATRSGLWTIDARERVFVVDFDLGMIDFDDASPRGSRPAPARSRASASRRLPGGNIARVGFHFIAGDAPHAEFRLSLESDGAEASEIRLYRWSA